MSKTKDLRPEGLLNYTQAAQYTGCSATTLYAHVNKHNLSVTIRDGRKYFTKDALDKWVIEQKYRRRRTGHVRHRKSFRAYRKGHRGAYFRNEYYGQIAFYGKTYEHYFSTYAAAEAWCRDMAKKYGEYY